MSKSKAKVPEDMTAGMVYETKNYGLLKILRYLRREDVVVQFNGFDSEVHTYASSIRKGKVKNPEVRLVMKKRTTKIPKGMEVGTIHKTTSCGDLEVVHYQDSKHVTVKFLGYDHKVLVESCQIKRGNVKNVMMPNVKGKGFMGVGTYSKGTNEKAYQTWLDALKRCYCEKKLLRFPMYIGCTVAVEWHNFQNFAKWFYEESNYEDGLHLDKDLIKQGNKVYSKKTCVFIPPSMNYLFTDSGATRGRYKLGVCFIKGEYKSHCGNNKGRREYLGSYKTEDEAHEAYKEYKYSIIRKVASEQPEPVKSALLRWKIPQY